MKKFFLSILFLAITSIGSSLEVAPWFIQDFEITTKSSFTYGYFNQVALKNHLTDDPTYNRFYKTSVFMSAFEDYFAELELGAFDTSSHSFNLEYGRLALRYLLLDDSTGYNTISLTLGLITTIPVKEAIYDISCFHHYYFEEELQLALGKQFDYSLKDFHRGFLLIGLGQATKGYPWIRSLFHYEVVLNNSWRSYFEAEYLQGLGNGNLNQVNPFLGYANINHKNVDFKLGLAYEWFPYMNLSFEYQVRGYAYNFPKNYQAGTFSLIIPFGL